MNATFFYMMNVTMSARLVYILNDGRLSRRQTGWLIGLQIAGLLGLAINAQWWLLAVLLFGLYYTAYRFLERPNRQLELIRLGILLAQVVIYSVFFSPWIDLQFNPAIAAGFQSVAHTSSIFAVIQATGVETINVVLFGLLLLTNEVNLLIRACFHGFNLMPSKTEPAPDGAVLVKTVDKREYNAGRFIGILERMLMFIFVLNGEIASIGFILAAKAFARFRELDQRSFAEYVLIGTLLSTLLAVLGAGLTKALLP